MKTIIPNDLLFRFKHDLTTAPTLTKNKKSKNTEIALKIFIELNCPANRVSTIFFKVLIKMGKKMVASNDLSKGTVINESHICFKSPGDGLFPDQIELILGRELKHKMHRDQAFTEKVFE